MKAVPLFPVATVGSWPRFPELLRAQKRKGKGVSRDGEFERVSD